MKHKELTASCRKITYIQDGLCAWGNFLFSYNYMYSVHATSRKLHQAYNIFMNTSACGMPGTHMQFKICSIQIPISLRIELEPLFCCSQVWQQSVVLAQILLRQQQLFMLSCFLMGIAFYLTCDSIFTWLKHHAKREAVQIGNVQRFVYYFVALKNKSSSRHDN